jgi:hypothetical protein
MLSHQKVITVTSRARVQLLQVKGQVSDQRYEILMLEHNLMTGIMGATMMEKLPEGQVGQ